jgi:hypothetical protein
VALTDVGVPGTEDGVAGKEAADAALFPSTFVAMTVKT